MQPYSNKEVLIYTLAIAAPIIFVVLVFIGAGIVLKMVFEYQYWYVAIILPGVFIGAFVLALLKEYKGWNSEDSK